MVGDFADWIAGVLICRNAAPAQTRPYYSGPAAIRDGHP